MKFTSKILVFGAIVLLFYGIYYSIQINTRQSLFQRFGVTQLDDSETETTDLNEVVSQAETEKVTVVAENLDTPWAIAFIDTNSMLVTERKGTVRLIKNGELASSPLATISNVREIGESGLQGIALHPNFKTNKFVYIYYTYSGGDDGTFNRVSRFVFDGNSFSNETVIVDAIPGAQNHDGGRIKFGPDGKLYITTGDAQNPSSAQDTNSFAGKILRVNDDGSAAPGNPFNNLIFSFGHRNPQGIAWDKNGNLWSTEHGPSGVETGNDEFNRIELGKNYGWPDIRGKKTKAGMEIPVLESGFLNAWAPAGLAYLKDKFYFAGLRGVALYQLDENGANLKTYLKGEYGRLREVVVGPDNMLYVTTSNQDGRGIPKVGDDKILRINPSKL